MHYSESSQAEAGQQIDRLRHMNQPVPSALFNENPDLGSNPSNSQNIPPASSDINNEQMAMPSDSNDEMFQHFSSSQQDSAQPGVPATNNPPAAEENDNDSQEAEQHDNQRIEPNQQNKDENYEEEKVGDYGYNEESKEHSEVHNPEKEANQERQGLEDTIRPNHQDEPRIESNNLKEDDPYENQKSIRKNEQSAPFEKSPSSDHAKRFTANSRKQSNGPTASSLASLHAPFGYNLPPPRSGTFHSFAGSSAYTSQPGPDSHLTSTYFQLNHSRNSGNPGSSHESVSSFPVTNYEDSEFMIQAYQRKKKAYEKTKQKLLQAESDLHMERQRCKMFQVWFGRQWVIRF